MEGKKKGDVPVTAMKGWRENGRVCPLERAIGEEKGPQMIS